MTMRHAMHRQCSSMGATALRKQPCLRNARTDGRTYGELVLTLRDQLAVRNTHACIDEPEILAADETETA